jgi:hypothetical protein
MAYTSYFSQSYEEARARLRASIEQAKGEYEAYPIGIEGPDGDPLTIDIGRIGPADAKRTLVLSSGTHGVEGFFGSAAQLAAIENWVEQPDRDASLVLIHAMNPYGFSYIRRVNENNVDLNRSFLLSDQPYQGADDAYAKRDLFLVRTVFNILRYGYRSLKNAVVQGQYEFPKGLFYGGRKPPKTLEIIDQHLETWLGDAEKVVHIDWHTGMGKWATYILATSRSMGTPGAEALQTIFGRDRVQGLEPSGVLYEIQGAFGRWCESRFSDRDYSCLLAEFGTYPSLKVLKALSDENRCHHWDTASGPATAASKQALREAFAPSASEWRNRCISQAMTIVEQAKRGL